MQHFTKLRVWHESHQWVMRIYKATRSFPPDERFGLTAQLRRAAAGVPSNIAEGSKRRSVVDYARFINIAESSLAEAEYQLILARDLGYVDPTEHLAQADEIAKMLFGLHDTLTARAERPRPRRSG
jgi:four helix bundle protein